MFIRLRIAFLLALCLICLSLAAKHSDDFLLGNYSYLRAYSSDMARAEILGPLMQEAGYNATVCHIFDSSSPAQIKQLLGNLDRLGIDAILTDMVWQERRPDPRYGTEALSISNYWRFEAEYDSSSTLNRDDDRYFYIHSGRTGKARSKTAASGAWLRVLEPGQKGYALNRMEFRWPTAGNPGDSRYDIGPEFRFVQRVYGNAEKDDFAASPCSDDTLYVTFAFNCSRLPADPATPILSLSFQGFGAQADSRSRIVPHFDPRSGKTRETTVLTAGDYQALPVLKRDSRGNKAMPHREIELRLPARALYDAGLIEAVRGWRYSLLNLNPRLWWEGKGRLELDYFEFEDTMHRQLRGNPALRDSVRFRVTDLVSANPNVSYLYLSDEPTQGQFSANEIIEHDLLAGLDKEIPSFKGLISCSWLYRRNVRKNSGDIYDLIGLFDRLARPGILMFDIYPLFGSVRWNRPEVARGIQRTLQQDLLDYYLRYKRISQTSGASFMPVTQTMGIWLYDQQRWGTLRPPHNMQKCLQFLPLCYGADGILNYKLYDVLGDPEVTKQTRQDHSLILIKESGGKTSPLPNPNWEAIKEANRKILIYGPKLRSLGWLDAETILTDGYRNQKQQASLGIDSLYVRPQNLTQNGLDLYDGYVQCGLFRQPTGAPALMLVNRRTEYVPVRLDIQGDDADELVNIPPDKLDQACQPAPPQTVRVSFAPKMIKSLVSPALWDPYDNSVYPLKDGGADIPIGPGDGRLLELTSMLPEAPKSRLNLSGKTLLMGPLQLRKGARVNQDADGELLILNDLTIHDGASLKLKGKVTIGDNVRVTVKKGGKLELGRASCEWGSGSRLLRD